MIDTIIEFFKTAGEWGIIAFGIAFACITITFITLAGFIVFIFVAKTVWTSMFGGTKSTEPVQYTLLKQFLLPVLTNGGKDLAKMVSDKMDEKEKAKAKDKPAKKESKKEPTDV